jgi:hypothetical protein
MLPILQEATHNTLAGAADYPDIGQGKADSGERERESKKKKSVWGGGSEKH